MNVESPKVTRDWHAVVARQGSQIDKAHDRLRDLDLEIDGWRLRFEGIDLRVASLEARAAEHREMLSDLRADVAIMKRESGEILEFVSSSKGTSERIMGMLQKHIHDEAEDYAKQTHAIERLSRRIIALFGVFGAILVILAALHSVFAGVPLSASLMTFIAKLLGGS